MFHLWFSFKNSRHTNVLLVVIFETAQKKVVDHQKRHFCRFWWLITFFCIFKNTDLNNICASTVFKAKTEEKYKENLFKSFYFKTWKCTFWGSTNFFSSFFSHSALKTIDTQMLFWSIFLKTHKKSYKLPKTAKIAFLTVYNFFCAFSKIPIKRTFVRLLFLKLNQSQNLFGGFSSKTKNRLFWVSKLVVFKTQISNLFFCVCFCKRKLHVNFHKKY